jgi:hypothetical protein
MKRTESGVKAETVIDQRSAACRRHRVIARDPCTLKAAA